MNCLAASGSKAGMSELGVEPAVPQVSVRPATPRAESPGPTTEVTWRAIVMGCVLGALLAAANTYTTLALGFLDGGYIVASVVSFAYFAPLRGLARAYSALENNLTQTIASSAAGMSMVIGLGGPIPALA